MTIQVDKPGLLTLLQDAGRYGYQKYGVIVSGAMDSFAHRTANLLVGNGPAEATMEMTVIGPTLTFEEAALIAVCGSNLNPRIGSEPLPLWRPVWVPAGTTLVCGSSRQGCRSYLAVAGGFDVPAVMGSYATYLRAGIGGYAGRALRPGDRLRAGRPTRAGEFIKARIRRGAVAGAAFDTVNWSVSRELIPAYAESPEIRITEGSQYALFDEASREALGTAVYRVQPASDRMGYRLAGERLQLIEPLEMVSEPVTFGTVQVPPDGQPIVLMADRQTTGGYPKIAQVISADLPLLAQAHVGSEIRFRMVSLQEAQEKALLVGLSLQVMEKSIQMYFSQGG
ncbi:biotin-dependent carboxyltransferase family protein [Paenibacillus daejeonensis]|uniref:5-oxoprolinase subunit C family protein n=1 Tax=Paenibacillus daejeonensis TaxID=135193 RepID=UPI0003790FB7|nr:biotin-dependent carboxyltransferase family protein [Paenibacillus daejeonensis]